MGDIILDLPLKEAKFLRAAVQNQIEWHKNQMENQTLSDDEHADLGNDCMLYECILEYIDHCLEKFRKEQGWDNL